MPEKRVRPCEIKSEIKGTFEVLGAHMICMGLEMTRLGSTYHIQKIVRKRHFLSELRSTFQRVKLY